MINRTVLNGRITKQPELQYTNSNIAFIKFILAVPRNFPNASGEYESDFISCVVWRKTAEYMAKHINKGGLIGVEGRIQTGRYETDKGVTIYTTDIVIDQISKLDFEKKQPYTDIPEKDNEQKRYDDLGVPKEQLPF